MINILIYYSTSERKSSPKKISVAHHAGKKRTESSNLPAKCTFSSRLSDMLDMHLVPIPAELLKVHMNGTK